MLAFFGPGGIGFWELMIILLIVMLLFGSKRIPELARGLGKGISEFKKGMSEGTQPPEPPKQTAADPTSKPGDTPKTG